MHPLQKSFACKLSQVSSYSVFRDAQFLAEILCNYPPGFPQNFLNKRSSLCRQHLFTRAEAEEETGFRVRDVRQVFDAFMSPGSVTERLFFFVGQYDGCDRVSEGGGNIDEGEDISVLEVTIDEAMKMIKAGEIRDGKTIMLLQHAALDLFSSDPTNKDAR